MWTVEQQSAITTRHCDVLVSAAAGSGKTAVLVERIITMITEGEHPVDIDKLLVVTFTNAAASEVKQRIGEAIAEKLEKNPTNTHLQNQLTYLNRADIKTLHAFCLQVIRENYYTLDIDPAMRTADETEVELLQKTVLDEVFEEQYQQEDATDFYHLVEIFGSDTKDEPLRQLVLDTYKFLLGCPDPLAWLEEKTEAFHLADGKTLEDTLWAKPLREKLIQEISHSAALLQDALALVQGISGFEKYEDTLKKEIEAVENCKEQCSLPFRHVEKVIAGMQFRRLPSIKWETAWEKDIADTMKALRKEAKDILDKKVKGELFPYRLETMECHTKALYPVVKSLQKVIALFMERYQALKKEKRILDFGDYEHFCMKVLLESGSTLQNIKPTAIALELQEKYEEILIDEYQDINTIQELILTAVSRKKNGIGNRFMVGDVKQSIYRFRLAMPQLFMEKYRRYTVDGDKEKKILLSKNFRSRKNVLDGINFIFRQVMSEAVGDLAYDEAAALYAGAEFPPFVGNCGGANELLLIDINGSKETEEQEGEEQGTEGDVLEELKKQEIEAIAIAQRIKQLMTTENFHVLDKKTGVYRLVGFQDIAILLRSIKSWSGVFENIFLREEIPFFAETAKGYFDTTEVMTMLHFLRIIDNPRQDIPLISVLHSPIYGLTADDLMEIRLLGGKGSYYACAENCLEQYTEEEYPWIAILEHLRKDIITWRARARDSSVSQLLWYLYRETGYFDYVGATAGGTVRQANLRLLIEKAEQYEQTSLKGVFHFIRYIETTKKPEDDTGSAKLLQDAENIVRITTIHKSKGLEFPVVFVADMGKQFNQQDMKKVVLLDHQLGIGLDYVDVEERTKYKSFSKMALKEKLKKESISEEMRVLYVALTRAKEKLILTGCVSHLEKQMEKWLRIAATEQERLPVAAMSSAKTYLDWVVPALCRHTAGKTFLKTYGFSFDCVGLGEESSQWSISATQRETIEQGRAAEQRTVTRKQEFDLWDTEKAYSSLRAEIFRRLAWEYGYKVSTTLAKRVSISELKRKWQQEEENTELWQPQWTEFALPTFETKGQKLTAVQVGTAMHTVMEQADLRKQYTQETLQELLETLTKQCILSEEEKKAIRQKEILSFFTSPLAEGLRQAKDIKKEACFSILVEAKDIFPEEKYRSVRDLVTINGIIDCFYEEEDGIVLLDYKTDRVWGEQAEEQLRQRYKIQIDLYRRALEQITGKRVKACYLYGFALGKAILC